MTLGGRRLTAGLAVLLLLAITLVGCDQLGLRGNGWGWPSPAPLPEGATAVPIELQPRFDIPEGAAAGCPQALFAPFEVRYVADDAARPVQYRQVPGGAEMPLRWQVGFSARLNPDLEIVAPDGRVIAREGDVLDDVGGAPPDVCYPEYLPHRAGS